MRIQLQGRGLLFTPENRQAGVVIPRRRGLRRLFSRTLNVEGPDGTIYALSARSFRDRLLPVLQEINPNLTWNLMRRRLGPRLRYLNIQNTKFPLDDLFDPAASVRVPEHLEQACERLRGGPSEMMEFPKEALIRVLQIVQEHGAQLAEVGSFDPETDVRHIRPDDCPDWELPYAIEIVEEKLFVLLKGKKRHGKLGSGSFKQVSLALNPLTGRIGAAGTVRLEDWKGIQTAEETERSTCREIEFMEQFAGDGVVVSKLHSHRYRSKNRGLRPRPHKIGIMMEYCNGGDLFRLVGEPLLRDVMGRDSFLQILTDLATVLEVMKREKVLHRDIKPENLLLHIPPDGPWRCRITDWGLAGSVETETIRMGAGGKACGTVEYIAPELLWTQTRSRQEVQMLCSHKTDVWGMGVVFYGLLCGFLPDYGRGPIAGPASCNQERIDRGFELIATPQRLGSYPRCIRDQRDGPLRADLRDLTRMMLQVDPNRRATVEEVVRWVAQSVDRHQ